MDARRKFFLFKQSQTFCSVPWNYIKIDVDGSVTTCVRGLEILGNINDQSLKQILANPKLTQIKKDLLADNIPWNCSACQKFDQQQEGYKYLRSMYNDWFKSTEVDYDDLDAFSVSGVDLHWANTCNLKCVTCWPKQSSALAQEAGIPITKIDRGQHGQVIDWLTEHQQGLKEIYFSGGEPSLIKHNIDLLKRLQPRRDLLLRVNTNMTFDANNRFMQELRRFPNVLITASADATAQRFEYIRHGASWDVFLDNLKTVLDQGWKARINSVFFVASASTLIETRQFFIDKFNISDFTINQCEMAQHSLLCRNLPDVTKQKVSNDLQMALQIFNDVNSRGQIQNCISEVNQAPNGHDYRAYFDEIDRRRGLTWRTVFKELT